MTDREQPRETEAEHAELGQQKPEPARDDGEMSLASPVVAEEVSATARDETAIDNSVKRAVLYLRVSTPSQVNTDYNPEGISIPAQRRACETKARQMGVHIVDEYVEAGKSATSMDGRVEFQAMLTRLRTLRDVEYVMVYELSRMNRNRIDDAYVVLELRKCGVSLLSATESIDDSPTGRLVHGVLASVNEFRSAKDGADIKYKMSEKARRGGTLGRAPLGYLNQRIRFEGREVRTVMLDEVRGPLVRLAFELYASGDYSIADLAVELSKRGLTTLPARYPATTVSTSKLHTMLQNRYYLGFVNHDGEEFEGRHEPLVSPELFERVQKVIKERSQGTRVRKHNHYLKGLLWCGRCYDEGRTTRMIFSPITSRHGTTFNYFVCRVKKDRGCLEPYCNADRVEYKLEDYYKTITFPTEFADELRALVMKTVDDMDSAVGLRRKQLEQELDRFDLEEDNLLDLAARGGSDASNAKIRRRLNDLDGKRRSLRRELDQATHDLRVGVELLDNGLKLVTNDLHGFYLRCNPEQRALVNQAVFKTIYIDNEEIVSVEYREP